MTITVTLATAIGFGLAAASAVLASIAVALHFALRAHRAAGNRDAMAADLLSEVLEHDRHFERLIAAETELVRMLQERRQHRVARFTSEGRAHLRVVRP